MAKRPRRNHSPVFKAKVALAAVKGDKTLVELSEYFDIHANQITQWKTQLLERARDAFDGAGSKEPPIDVKTLHAKIGELAEYVKKADSRNDAIVQAYRSGGYSYQELGGYFGLHFTQVGRIVRSVEQ